MPTLTGDWEGENFTKARMRVEYTRSYNSDHTSANFEGTVYIEFDGSISDSNNTWNVGSPDFTDQNGSNLNISFGSGGGKKKLMDFDFWNDGDDGDGEISASVSGIEYIGETVEYTFDLDTGDLAPYFNSDTYTAVSITATSFTTSTINGNGNGDTLNNLQVMYNTAASSSGATTKTVGSYANTTVTGLTRATNYYYRIRISNEDYGYGEWGPWKSLTTSSTVPGAPEDDWLITNITQTTADTDGTHVVDNGGQAIDNWRLEYNTAPNSTGSTVVTSGTTSVPNMTGLTPGTTYYARAAAHNSIGWGAYNAWKSFTTLPGVSVKVSGVWKNAQPYVNVGGEWKLAVRYVNVGGVWKQ